MSEAGRDALAIYYFAFPHYRREILREIAQRADHEVLLLSGSVPLADITALGEGDIPRLRIAQTVRLGPLSWDRGVFWPLVRLRGPVILGPATRSATTWAVLVGRWLRGRASYLWGQCGRPGDRSPKRYVQEMMNRLASGLLVYGAAEAESACELGTSPSKVRIVHNATESNREWVGAEADVRIGAALNSRVDGVRRGEIRVLFVGRLLEEKKIDVLAEAVENLVEEYPNISLDIVGAGSAASDLITRYAGERCVFHGELLAGPHRDRLFETATFVVSPFHMGLLAVDAVRFGVPTLVPDNVMNASEVEALTVGVNARTFHAGDAEDLSAAMSRWLRDYVHTNIEAFLDARDRALRIWSPEHVASQILAATNLRVTRPLGDDHRSG